MLAAPVFGATSTAAGTNETKVSRPKIEHMSLRRRILRTRDQRYQNENVQCQTHQQRENIDEDAVGLGQRRRCVFLNILAWEREEETHRRSIPPDSNVMPKTERPVSTHQKACLLVETKGRRHQKKRHRTRESGKGRTKTVSQNTRKKQVVLQCRHLGHVCLEKKDSHTCHTT